MNRSDLVREWMVIARDDLETAQFLFDGKRPVPIEIVCFHAQQASEKALKAVLQMNDLNIPRTHDLVELLRMTGKFVNEMHGMTTACSELSVYGVVIRYPGRPDLDVSDANSAIISATYIVDSCLSVLRAAGFGID